MKNNMFQLCLVIFLYIGTVDLIEGDVVLAQVTASDNKMRELILTTHMFPCEIKEGDAFYFGYSNGVTEIRCGEPEE
jgi:hypothetical protein